MRSPIQFYLYITTFIDELKKTDVDVGVSIDFSIVYADDMVMFAEEEEGLVRC